MRALTTGLLTIGILLVAGLAIGWQVTQWLREDTLAVAPPESAADATIPKEVRLLSHGGPLQIDRVEGDLAAAREAMRKRCRELASAAPPQGAAGPGEKKFLARLATESPIEQSKELSFYEPAGEPTMSVVVHRASRRIVVWGFAFPADEGGWTAYTFCPQTAMNAALFTEPSPPGAAP